MEMRFPEVPWILKGTELINRATNTSIVKPKALAEQPNLLHRTLMLLLGTLIVTMGGFTHVSHRS